MFDEMLEMKIPTAINWNTLDDLKAKEFNNLHD